MVNLILNFHMGMFMVKLCNIHGQNVKDSNVRAYPNKCSNDLYNSCSCCGVGDLWLWDPCILKDIIGIEPDLQ